MVDIRFFAGNARLSGGVALFQFIHIRGRMMHLLVNHKDRHFLHGCQRRLNPDITRQNQT